VTGGRRALVVFSGQTELWWLRLLKPGFRHCFVAVADPAGWVVVDPLSHRTEISVLPVGPEFDLAGWYLQAGLSVVETTTLDTPLRPAPWRPYSCVESVKRVLGIQAGGILTPWQLKKFLAEQEKKCCADAAVRDIYVLSQRH
jgi:hypothetical protein